MSNPNPNPNQVGVLPQLAWQDLAALGGRSSCEHALRSSSAVRAAVPRIDAILDDCTWKVRELPHISPHLPHISPHLPTSPPHLPGARATRATGRRRRRAARTARELGCQPAHPHPNSNPDPNPDHNPDPNPIPNPIPNPNPNPNQVSTGSWRSWPTRTSCSAWAAAP